MELNKKTTLRIILILFATVAFCIGLIHISSVWAAVNSVLGIFTPLILGLCLAFLLSPLAGALEVKIFGSLARRFPKKGKTVARGLAIFTSIIIVAGVVAMLILLIVPEFEQAFTILGNTLPVSITKLITNINSFLAQLDVSFRIPVGVSANWTTLQSSLKAYIQSAFENGALGDIANKALTVVSWFANLILGLIFSVYVLIEKEKILEFVSRFIRAYSSEKTAARIFKVSKLTKTSFRNFVAGQLTEAVIIGMLCFFGMLIFRFPYPMATSAVVGVMTVIPIFGAWIGAIIGAMLALSSSFTTSLLFILFIVILQQLDGDFIYPKVVGKSVGLPGILVFVSVILGAGIGGIIGILIAIPICSIIYVLIKEAIDKRLFKIKSEKELEAMPIIPPPKS